MNVAILNKRTSTGGSTYLELACGNTSAFIGFPSYGAVSVCVNNAAHKVFTAAHIQNTIPGSVRTPPPDRPARGSPGFHEAPPSKCGKNEAKNRAEQEYRPWRSAGLDEKHGEHAG